MHPNRPPICLKFVFGRGASPPWSPYQGFALDPLGGLGGPQTPCLLCFHIVQGLATPLMRE